MTTDDSAPTTPVSATIWLIDGFNVLHASVLGGRDRSQWWNESHRAELLGRIREFDDSGAEIWVVFDGPGTETESAASPPTDSRRASLRTVFAPLGGRLARRSGAGDTGSSAGGGRHRRPPGGGSGPSLGRERRDPRGIHRPLPERALSTKE